MIVKDIQTVMESWAPKEIAWDKDNVGLQTGNPRAKVRGILVCLDVTEEVIAEAARRRANLIVSHHPLLFRPLRSVTSESMTGRCLRSLVRADISLYSAHTNLDFTTGGTSFVLARVLGLTHAEMLHTPYRVEKKVVTFVPPSHAGNVIAAMSKAGAGVIGNYDHCSYGTVGTGTFRGNEASSPTVGRKGVLERVEEVRIEMIVPEWRLGAVLEGMRRAHPYEEVAYDVYPLENRSREFGMGVIGDLQRPVTLASFLHSVKKKLGVRVLRCCGDMNRRVSRIAVCGGSGSELIDEAKRMRADVFITADVRYHAFHEVGDDIALVDAGHYETEHPVVQAVVDRLRRAIGERSERIPVHAARTSTNPIRCV